MKIFNFFVGIFSLFSLVTALADQNGNGNTDTTSVTATTVWVTITTNGALATVKSLYTQTFLSTPTVANTADVKSGSIALGTSGSVGGIRTYSLTTINGGNGGFYKSENVYAGIAGMCFLLVGALL